MDELCRPATVGIHERLQRILREGAVAEYAESAHDIARGGAASWMSIIVRRPCKFLE